MTPGSFGNALVAALCVALLGVGCGEVDPPQQPTGPSEKETKGGNPPGPARAGTVRGAGSQGSGPSDRERNALHDAVTTKKAEKQDEPGAEHIESNSRQTSSPITIGNATSKSARLRGGVGSRAGEIRSAAPPGE